MVMEVQTFTTEIFKLKFDQLRQETGSSSLQDEYHWVSHIVDECTHFVCEHVMYENVKDRFVPIFTRSALEHAEAEGKGSMDTMSLLCSSAKSLMTNDFIKFVEALAQDHVHAAEKIMQSLDSLIAKIRTQSSELAAEDTINLRIQEYHAPNMAGGTVTSTGRPTDCARSPTSGRSSGELHSAPLSNGSSYCTHRSGIRLSGGHQAYPGSPTDPQSGYQDLLSPVNTSQISTRQTCSASPRRDLSTSGTSVFSFPAPAQDCFALHPSPNSAPVSEVYDMSTQPRGLALIINNENFQHWSIRQGSSVDVKNLYNMFRYLGFQVRTEPDKTAQEMKTILQKFSQHAGLATVSSLAVVILTHGSCNDCLFGIDGLMARGQPVPGTFITKMDIIHLFKGSVCRAMEGKPKLFILQACRGDEENSVQADGSSSDDTSPKTSSPCSVRQDAPPVAVPPQSSALGVQSSSGSACGGRPGKGADTADMCFVYSSSYGYKAYRTRSAGSPFIAMFTDTMKQLAGQVEFRDIIQKIQKEFNKGPLVNQKMTLPDFSLQLMNKWYLNPPQWANSV